MNKKQNHENKHNKIEDITKEIFSYDQESLLEEFHSAEAEANQQNEDGMDQGPDADNGYAALRARMKQQGITPIYAKDYVPENTENFDDGTEEEAAALAGTVRERDAEPKRKVIRLKGMVKISLIAATLAVVLFGGSLVTFGKRSYLYWERQFGGGKSRNIINSAEEYTGYNIFNSYREIEEMLDIRAIQLTYVPDGLKYLGLEFQENRAIMQFKYKERWIYFVQMKAPSEETNLINSDFEQYKMLDNIWLDKKISIGKNKLETGEVEYHAELMIRDTLYYLYGVLEEEEFEMMVEQWNFFVDH